MKVKLSILAAAALAATFGLSGCGGNEDPSDVAAATVSGVALDGYIRGGKVCVDTDGNESTCEYNTTTGESGSYLVPLEYRDGTVTVTGGIDNDTGAPFRGVLKSRVIGVTSPLTTILHHGMPAAQVAGLFGIREADIAVDYRANNTVNVPVARAALICSAYTLTLPSIIQSDNPNIALPDIQREVVDGLKRTMSSPADLTDSTKIQAVLNGTSAGNISNSGSIANSIATTVTTLQDPNTIINSTTISTLVTSIANTQYLASGVYVDNSAVTIAGQNTTFTQSGVLSDVNISAGTTNMSISMPVINKSELSTTPKSVTLGVKIDDLASTRELKAILSGATVALDGSGNVVVTVPAGAVLYAEAMSSTSTTPYTASVPNAASNFFVSSGGVLSVDLSTLMSKVVSAVPSVDFANLSVVGNYAVSFYVDGLTLGYETIVSGGNGDVLYLNAPVETLSASTKTMSGSKLTGKVNVQ